MTSVTVFARTELTSTSPLSFERTSRPASLIDLIVGGANCPRTIVDLAADQVTLSRRRYRRTELENSAALHPIPRGHRDERRSKLVHDLDQLSAGWRISVNERLDRVRFTQT